eukprot:m.237593 g.237593  ORF g.237593 m.237593 type:complete len:591 (-) comp21225_c0_seq1:25-1797(-)
MWFHGALCLALLLLGSSEADPIVISTTWRPIGTLQTTPTFQVVAHPLLMRDSPIHDALFSNLAKLPAQHIRYVPWLPYPKLGVAALNPPSGKLLCGGLPVAQGWALSLDCGPNNGVINDIIFASYGTPQGTCGSFQRGACHALNSTDIVKAACVGRRGCVINVPTDASTFGDPCFGTLKSLAVAATCSGPGMHTYWNWSYIDDMFLDFWDAIKGNKSEPVINFSTPPNWLFSSTWSYPDNPATVSWSYETGTTCKNLTALGEYYGRVASWYIKGGLHDEYGQYHASGHRLNLTQWEVLNEVAHEHANTKESYTALYDAIVLGMKAALPAGHHVSFTGLAMANIDSTDMLVEWVEYFLDPRNHKPGVPIDTISYHAYPTASFGPDASQYTGFFSYVDEFMGKIDAIEAVRQRLAPRTKVSLNEVGTIADTAIDTPLYWTASAAYFAYFFMSVSMKNISLLGQSQYVGAPGQFPSVSMINWTDGSGTARFWGVHLLLEHFQTPSTRILETLVQAGGIAALAYEYGESGNGVMLLVNTKMATTSVRLPDTPPNASAQVIDSVSGSGPARSVPLDNHVLQLLPYATAVVPISRG